MLPSESHGPKRTLADQAERQCRHDWTLRQWQNHTLTAALSARQAHRFGGRAMTYEGIAKGGMVRDESKILSILAAHVEYETKYRHYEHIDSQGSQVAEGSND
jgi:hypothetical protein